MTKGQMIEAVYLSVSGGRPAADVDVHRADIENLLGAAISFVMNQHTDEMIKRNAALLRLFGAAVPQLSGQFATTLNATPVEDLSRGLYYIDLVSGLLPMPGNSAIDMLAPKKGRTAYTRISSQSEVAGIPDCLPVTFYWLEGSRIWIDGLSFPVCEHIVKVFADPVKAGDDTEFNLPDGIEMRTIEMLTQYFINQRLMPQDVTYTDTDERNQAKVQRGQ